MKFRASCLFSRRTVLQAQSHIWDSNSNRRFASSHMDKFAYTGALPDESLHRYTLGGYHPVHLGDVLKDGRYKVMHKLGVGGYSTLWAAKDLSKGENPFVAIKITVAELHKRNRELKVMRSLETMRIEQALSPHLMPMLDHFSHTGPNGVHDCLVLELLGQNIPDFQEIRCNYRLPGGAAKRIAKQALSGIDCLHQRQIAHGGNICKYPNDTSCTEAF